MKRILLSIVLIITCIFCFTACSATTADEILVQKEGVYYPNNITYVDKNNKTAFELTREKYHMCGEFSENRLFCIGVKTGINVDVIEDVYSNVLVNLYLLDNKGTLMQTYSNAIIPAHEVEFLERYIPKFENGTAVIYLVNNHDTDKLTGDDVISKNDIVECSIDKYGKINKENVNMDFELLPAMDSESNAKNQVWVGTFQLVWNDLIDELIKHPIEFVGEKSPMAESLNKKAFSVNDLSANAYYKRWGLASSKLKSEIENGIQSKFNETSDILDSLDWTPAEKKYILYAMLKKDFEFIEKFNKLEDGIFKGSENKIEYFGIDGNGGGQSFEVFKKIGEQKKSVKVLFYNNDNDFAVQLKSKQGDEVYLYRTDDDKTLENYYKDINEKTKSFTGKKYLGSDDKFKAPLLDFKSERNFDELCHKEIKNSDFIISQAIETIKFKMDEAGVKLKSEAVIACETGCLPFDKPAPRYFYFNDKYVIFISEEGKNPYFGMKITDAEKLQKGLK